MRPECVAVHHGCGLTYTPRPPSWLVPWAPIGRRSAGQCARGAPVVLRNFVDALLAQTALPAAAVPAAARPEPTASDKLHDLSWQVVALLCVHMVCKAAVQAAVQAAEVAGDKAVQAAVQAAEVAGDKDVEAATVVGDKVGTPLAKAVDVLEGCTCVAACAPREEPPPVP